MNIIRTPNKTNFTSTTSIQFKIFMIAYFKFYFIKKGFQYEINITTF